MTVGGARVALLRGINVGGHRKVPMAELRTLLTELCFDDVATYVQSGNAVFSGGPVDVVDAEGSIVRAIADRFGFDVPVCVRDRSELVTALDRSTALFPPSDDAGGPHDKRAHDKRVHVGFLSAVPVIERVAAIDPGRSPGDVVIVDGREAHVYYAVGAGSSKMTSDYIERTLDVAMTMRNLTTLRKLVDLVR